jgi:hypothetical protein
MADDHTLRSYRSNEPRRRATEPSRPAVQPLRQGGQAGASDPLAELARLIGQNDPLAEFGRNSPRQSPQANYVPQRADYAPEPDYSRHETYAEPEAEPEDWQQTSAPEQNYASEGSRHRDSYGSSPDYGHPEFARSFAHDPRAHDPRDARIQEPPADDDYDDAPVAAHRQGQHYADDRLHAGALREDAEQEEEEFDYPDEGPLEPQDDELYDDAPRARRHGGLATALALIGCAMLGTAGAYAYRSYTGNPGSTQPPPVITADSSTPIKIIPATAGDPQSGKVIQDRLATAGKEQVISKQEEPVALQELGTQQAPRVVLPAPVSPAPGGAAGGPGGEPRKVRTVTIRPDGTDVSGRPVGPLPSGMPAPASVASRPAPAPALAPTPPAPRAAPPAAAAAVPARNGSAPLSLEPQSGEPAVAAPASRARTATASPPPDRAAAEPTTNSTGGFVVQLSSQKSEGEAQSSFRSLQAKFPNELGNRQPIIRRADLGSKGVFYRTMVGPFASAQEASQFCTSYKSAGGQCIVPREN